MDLEHLRRETLLAHHAVEQSVSLMDEDLDVDTYVSCLLKLHGMVAAWEEWAAPHASAWIQPLLAARRRGQLLMLDLTWFDADTSGKPRPTLPELRGLPACWGRCTSWKDQPLAGS